MAVFGQSAGKTLQALAALVVLAVLSVLAGTAAAQGEWRVYRDRDTGFKLLYPPQLKAKALKRRVDTMLVVQEWTREGGKATIRLTLIDKPAGMALADWLKRESEGPTAQQTIAGRTAYVQEGVFEGQLTTEVWIDDPARGKIINFTHSVAGIENWRGQPVMTIKRRYLRELGDFWNMVESIEFKEES